MDRFLTHSNALAVLALWVVLQAAWTIYSSLRGEVMQAMLLAVDKAGPLKNGESREGMARSFVYISVAWFVLITALATYAFHAGYGGSVVWQLVFLLAGGWSLYESASSPFVLGRMYPGTIGWPSWVGAVVGASVWLFAFATLAVKLFMHAS